MGVPWGIPPPPAASADAAAGSTSASRSHSTATSRHPAASRRRKHSGLGQAARASRIHSIFVMERLLQDPPAKQRRKAHSPGVGNLQFLCPACHVRNSLSTQLFRVNRARPERPGHVRSWVGLLRRRTRLQARVQQARLQQHRSSLFASGRLSLRRLICPRPPFPTLAVYSACLCRPSPPNAL